MKLPFPDKFNITQVFRPIHYLGSKLRILDFIEKSINEIDPSYGRVYDLFSGSGSVSLKLSRSRPVTAVDIQEYSRVICSALLLPKSDSKLAEKFLQKVRSSEYIKKLVWSIEPLIEFEKSCISNALSHNTEPLCDLVEHGSIITYELKSGKVKGSPELLSRMRESIRRLKSLKYIAGPEALAIRHTGGLYFSYYQAAQIDTILHFIHELNPSFKDTFLASLISTVSDTVNTVGKQFAQPLRPKTLNGKPKPNLGEKVQKDRSINVFNMYEAWLDKYMAIQPNKYRHLIKRLDYLEALDDIESDTTIIYADPPYTRDHYSRYYHTLETLCLQDNPEVTRTIQNGETLISRGIYRQKRHQSPFCIKSQATPAFDSLIRKVRSYQLPLAISYSPYDKTQQVRPRLLTMEALISIAKKYYSNVEIISAGKFNHSKLTHTSKHLAASKEAELLIICQI